MRTAPTPLLVDTSRHGENPAVLLADRTITHAELADLVDERAGSWGTGRRLVLVEGGNRLDSLVAHLAALHHGHVSLLVPADRPEQRDALVAAYDPDVACTADGDHVRRAESAHDLHPDLALLLSTSGSTGSPKLVRLSHTNVASNAEAIADYLGLDAHSRAITTLPLHYCYGLSVVHSHLAAGGSVALTDLSVVDECFWDFLATSRATSLAAVPYTFDLLERAGFTRRSTPSLRQITAAGGRLAPESVRRWGTVGQAEGWDLVVMYGQTEATARMAWLPPHLAAEHPDAIGVPVPGGTLRIDPVAETDEPGVGELVYSGPNVMMGYAHTPADLAGGPELDELRTGDLGRLRDGLFEVVGRRNRFAKLFGLRLDLARVEGLLADNGSPAELVATEAAVHAFAAHGRHAEVVRSRVADFCGIPVTAVRTHVVPDLPRTPNGKVDRAALQRLADLEERALAEGPDAGPAEDPTAWTVATVGRLLGRPDAGPADTFVTLGGDSLSFVETAAALEAHLGPLPQQWHTMPLGELALPRTDVGDSDAPTPPKGPRLDTTVTIRALAIVAVVASHVDLVSWEGGAHLLLALAGFNFARFQLGSPDRRTRLRNGLSSLLQLLVPSVLVLGLVSVFTGHYTAPTVFFLNGLLGSDTWTDQWQMWFLEALAWITAGALALVAVPVLHRWERARPFAFALGLVVATSVLRWAWTGQHAGPTERYTTGVVAFCFALGWLAARADTTPRRLVTMAAATVTLVGFFGDTSRELVVLVGLAAMLWLPTLAVPRHLAGPLGRVVTVLATSSLFIYLTHWVIYAPLEDAGHRWIAFFASLAVGIATAYAARPLQRWIAGRVRPRTPVGSGHVDPVAAA